MQWKRAREKPRTMLCVSFHKLKGASALADSSTGFPTPCPTPLISFMASPVCTRFSSMLSARGLRKQTQAERELRKLPPSLAFNLPPCPCALPLSKAVPQIPSPLTCPEPLPQPSLPFLLRQVFRVKWRTFIYLFLTAMNTCCSFSRQGNK